MATAAAQPPQCTESRFDADLDDHAFLAAALLDLYEAAFDVRWLETAREIADIMLVKFWDREEGGFFFTSPGHTHLLVRDKPVFDGAEPSGNAMAAYALLRLATFTGEPEYLEKAERILRINHATLEGMPRAQLKLLCAADFYLSSPKEIAIAGKTGARDVRALFQALHRHYIPNKVVAFIAGSDASGCGTSCRCSTRNCRLADKPPRTCARISRAASRSRRPRLLWKYWKSNTNRSESPCSMRSFRVSLPSSPFWF